MVLQLSQRWWEGRKGGPTCFYCCNFWKDNNNKKFQISPLAWIAREKKIKWWGVKLLKYLLYINSFSFNFISFNLDSLFEIYQTWKDPKIILFRRKLSMKLFRNKNITSIFFKIKKKEEKLEIFVQMQFSSLKK